MTKANYMFAEKLRVLLTILDEGISGEVKGSPAGELLFLLADLAVQIPSLLRRISEAVPGLKFQERISEGHPSKGEGYEEGIYPTDREQERHLLGDFPVQYDPVEDIHYFYQADPLGNPLQVSIDFGRSSLFSRKDHSLLTQVFNTISEFFELIAVGRIQWPFVRAIESLFKTPKPSDTLKLTKIHGYFNRKNHSKRRVPRNNTPKHNNNQKIE
jgi:hypothetical protein